MGCINHPNAPVAATCKKCRSELCGTYTRFLDAGEFCEKCAALVESEAFIKSRDRNEEVRQIEITQTASARIMEEEARQKERDKDGLYVKGGIILACMMLIVSMGIYAYPDLMKSEVQIAQEESIIRLEQCREVFQAIGIMLSEGRTPDSTMSCPGTNVPNIISRSGNTTTVSHPNPRQFGLSELYVTSDSHRVVMTAQGQG